MRRASIEGITRRGLRRAGAVGLLAVAAEVPHGIEDVHRHVLRVVGLTSTTGNAVVAVVVLVAAGAAVSLLALAGRRWAARPLIIIAGLWALAAMAGHPAAFTHPAAFRTGWLSASAVWVLIAANAASVVWAAAPALPARLDALKISPAVVRASSLSLSTAVVLDVRTGWERRWHPMPGALPAPLRSPEGALPPDAGEVVVVCSHGGRSLQAVRHLRRLGVDAWSLAGGERTLRAP